MMRFVFVCSTLTSAVADVSSFLQTAALKEDSARLGWTTAVQADSAGTGFVVDIGATAFNEKFAACPAVQYFRNGVVSSVYVRTSAIPAGFDAYTLFTHTWASANNLLHSDFEIYSTEQAARAQSGEWNFCNYYEGIAGVGYPRDCGPNGPVGGTWFGPHDPRITANNFFQLWDGGNCPAIAYDEAFGGIAVGDPHCRNVLGDKFDIHATGSLTFAKVPISALGKSTAEFMVVGEVSRATSDECGPTYITEVEVMSRGHPTLKISPSTDQVPTIDATTLSTFTVEHGKRLFYSHGNMTVSAYDKTSGKVTGSHLLKVSVGRFTVSVAQRTERGVSYLDLRVHGLQHDGPNSGGLLGTEDHTKEQLEPKSCKEPKHKKVHEVGSVALAL